MAEAPPVEHQIFLVDDKPFCVWGYNLHAENLSFINRIDPKYFEYVADLNLRVLHDQGADQTARFHAALAIRTTYSQSLETLFALIFSCIQAPYCIWGWFNKYQNPDLRKLVQQIHDRRPVISFQNTLREYSWDGVANSIFEATYIDNRRLEDLRRGLAATWSKAARDYLSEQFEAEYNGFKHGLRINPSSFELEIGPDPNASTSNADSNSTFVAYSEFGSNQVTLEKIDGRPNHHRLAVIFSPWDMARIAQKIRLVTLSIRNIAIRQRASNGLVIPPHGVQSLDEASRYTEPWTNQNSNPVLHASFRKRLDVGSIPAGMTKNALKARYLNGDITG